MKNKQILWTAVICCVLIAGVATAAFDDVFVGNSAGDVWLRDSDNLSGVLSDSLPDVGAVSASAALSNGNIVVGNDQGYVYVLDGSDFSVVGSWNDTPGRSVGAIAVQSDDSIILATNSSSGTPLADKAMYIFQRDSTLSSQLSWNWYDGDIGQIAIQSDDDVVFTVNNFADDADKTYIKVTESDNLDGHISGSWYNGSSTGLGIQSDDDIVHSTSQRVLDDRAYLNLFDPGDVTSVKSFTWHDQGDYTHLAVQADDDVVITRVRDADTFWLDIREAGDMDANKYHDWYDGTPVALEVQSDDDFVVARNLPAGYAGRGDASVAVDLKNADGSHADGSWWSGEGIELALQSDDDIVLTREFAGVGHIQLSAYNDLDPAVSDVTDFGSMAGLTIQVPEPATMALLAVGGILSLLRRRRK